MNSPETEDNGEGDMQGVAIEQALAGFAKDGGAWELGKWVFEDQIAKGVDASLALTTALDAASDGAVTSRQDAEARFWNASGIEAPTQKIVGAVQLGRKIHAPMGKSMSAGTYEARTENRDVIVKNGSADDLATERQVLASVDYVGIPKLIQYFENVQDFEGLDSLAMERIPGDALSDLMEIKKWRNQPINKVTAARIGMGLIDCLSALSNSGYLYRDLTPDHIFVDIKDEGYQVGLIDVEACVPKGSDGTAVVSNEARGTWETMAPEEFRDVAIMTEASNVYSAATIVLQLVSGRTSFHIPGSVIDDWELRRKMVEFAHNQELHIEGFGALDAILQKALHPEPEQRYQSLAAFKTAFEAVT